MARIHEIAKKIRKANKKLTWPQALKKAAATPEMKRLQRGGTNIFNDKARAAKAPGKRKSASGRTYYERRKNRSDAPGEVTGTHPRSIESSVYAIRDMLERDAKNLSKQLENMRANKVKRTDRVYKQVSKNLQIVKDQLRKQNQLINQFLK